MFSLLDKFDWPSIDWLSLSSFFTINVLVSFIVKDLFKYKVVLVFPWDIIHFIFDGAFIFDLTVLEQRKVSLSS